MNIVGNYPLMKQTKLSGRLSSFRALPSATLVKDKYSGQSRGFSFMEMPIESQARTAIKSLNEKDLMGREIKVEQAYDPAGRGRVGRRMEGGGRRNRY